MTSFSRARDFVFFIFCFSCVSCRKCGNLKNSFSCVERGWWWCTRKSRLGNGENRSHLHISREDDGITFGAIIILYRLCTFPVLVFLRDEPNVWRQFKSKLKFNATQEFWPRISLELFPHHEAQSHTLLKLLKFKSVDEWSRNQPGHPIQKNQFTCQLILCARLWPAPTSFRNEIEIAHKSNSMYGTIERTSIVVENLYDYKEENEQQQEARS